MINENTNTIYISNPGSDSVSVINGTSNTKIKNIPVGPSPDRLAIDENINIIYVANSGSDTISIIFGKNNIKVKDIPVGKYPKDLVINKNTNTIYVANSGSNTVSVINGYNLTKIKDIPVGKYPTDLVTIASSFNSFSSVPENPYNVTYTWNIIYVSNSGSDSVSVINGTSNTKIKDIPIGSSPGDLSSHEVLITYYQHIRTHDIMVYVANSGSDSVSVINGTSNTKIKDIPVGNEPRGFGGPILGALYVSTEKGVSIVDIETEESVARVS